MVTLVAFAFADRRHRSRERQVDIAERVVLDHAEHAIFALADERIRQGFEHIKHPAERVLEKAEAVEHRDLVVTGVATGFRGLDSLTSGLQKQDLVVIAARPSMAPTRASATGSPVLEEGEPDRGEQFGA